MSDRTLTTARLAAFLLLLLSVAACAIIDGSAYRVTPRPLCPADSVQADSLRRSGVECRARDTSAVRR